jgi:hypothetical protein
MVEWPELPPLAGLTFDEMRAAVVAHLAYGGAVAAEVSANARHVETPEDCEACVQAAAEVMTHYRRAVGEVLQQLLVAYAEHRWELAHSIAFSGNTLSPSEWF